MASIPHLGALRHGGRLREATAAYPDVRGPWLDLSTGINPEPWSGARASAEALRTLPDPELLTELEAVAARAFGVADRARVVAVAGADAALRLLPLLLDGGDVALAAPIYGGHAEAWAERKPLIVTSVDDRRAVAADILVLVNPNNPDGRQLRREALTELAEARSALGRWTIVDEAFVEVTPGVSVADLEIERLIVLRSFGKFYGLPGARLGFIICDKVLAKKLRAVLGDWPVCADALALGLGAYADDAWRATTIACLAAQARNVDAVLSSAGLAVVGGCDLFRWVEAPDAHRLFVGLCRRGVLTRPFVEHPTRLRFGIPSRGNLDRLREALQAVRHAA
ncbi:threonine-phosphate decarboxylase [Caulobacter segnis]|uniref:Aminotransferase n=2 Tax=Caulobacter segnis TaxID=88688 RepID=D5VGM1_CAUST|nr:aminotransferase class I/II-fold pyridoxal phosphate-dependent enzyme [Caulobacter segnis]ADG10464.1 aminotransferase class I and II [Caulobacter segnis ATCC 21756]AVQ02195.1 threonine-phosphate decarboxylase [Caulobacter segnis]